MEHPLKRNATSTFDDDIIIYTHHPNTKQDDGQSTQSNTVIYISDDDDISGDKNAGTIQRSAPSHQIKKSQPSDSLIKRGPYGPKSITGYSRCCIFGNNMKLTSSNIRHLKQIVRTKKHQIPFYVCKMKKGVIGPNKRMYFSGEFHRNLSQAISR